MERNAAHVARIIFDVLSVHADSPLGRKPESWGARREADGSYTIAGGMSRAQVGAMSRRAFIEHQVAPARFSAGEQVHSMASGNVSRVLHPMLRSHGLLSRDQALARLTAGRAEELYPVVLGELEDGTDGRLWRPVRAAETPLMNARARPSSRHLSALEAQTATLADGRHAVSETRAAVGGAGDGVAEDFLRTALQDGLAVAFARPWPEPGAGVY